MKTGGISCGLKPGEIPPFLFLNSGELVLFDYGYDFSQAAVYIDADD